MLIKEKLDSFLIGIAEEKIHEVDSSGFIAGGFNGPYKCVDTPVRNSAHWCVTFSYLFRVTGNKKYLDCMNKLVDYIIGIQAQSISGAVKCMEGDGFTDTNGLIGQAWAIEGLLYVYKCIKNDDYLKCAINIFQSQIFDYESGEWYQIDTKGENMGIDIAFNHQLWFAAIGMELNVIVNNFDITSKLNRYLEKLDEHFQTYSNGLIKHLGNIKKELPLINKIKKSLKKTIPVFIAKRDPDSFSVISFESAYQLFNLYGFSIIKNNNRNLAIFKSKKFRTALDYGKNIKRLNKIFNVTPEVNEKVCKYAYPYNSPAFEYGFIAEMFDFDYAESTILDLIEIQKRLCFSQETMCFDRNTYDPNTLTARVYELVRYLEMVNL